jgi:hypothetical protein
MIPKTIFSYWEGPMPSLIQHCLQQIQKANPACQFVCLGRQHVPVVHGVSALSVQHRSDLARIHVLSTHGGVWMDASCMCPLPVETWVDFNVDQLQGFQVPWDDEKQIENWAMASPANFPLTMRWAAECQYAVRCGFDRYKQLMRGVIPGKTWVLMPYLTMHGAWCVARMKHGNDTDVTMRPSIKGQGPLRYLADNRWSTIAAVWNLKQYCGRLYFIKLRRVERIALQCLQWLQWFMPAAFCGVVIMAAVLCIREIQRRRRG